jgi:hypothetical protein
MLEFCGLSTSGHGRLVSSRGHPEHWQGTRAQMLRCAARTLQQCVHQIYGRAVWRELRHADTDGRMSGHDTD